MCDMQYNCIVYTYLHMYFKPNIKRKRGVNKWLDIKPFPPIELEAKCEGIFTGISVEVCAKKDVVVLYENGCYGKGSLSRSTPKVVIQNANRSEKETAVLESLSLGLEEAFFLAYYLNVLKISNLEGQEIKCQKFLQASVKINATFVETLAAYLYLKSKGWVVKSGLKFGGNYLIYFKGPRFYHASFVVLITTPSNRDHLYSNNFKGLLRIAETSDKDVLVLEVLVPTDFQLLDINDISNIKISEMIIRRFNCTSHVQNKNVSK